MGRARWSYYRWYNLAKGEVPTIRSWTSFRGPLYSHRLCLEDHSSEIIKCLLIALESGASLQNNKTALSSEHAASHFSPRRGDAGMFNHHR